MDLQRWIRPGQPFEVRRPRAADDWKALLEEYVGPVSAIEFERGEGESPSGESSSARNISPFWRALKVAEGHRCQTVVIESRYVDPDYRSEYAAFWSLRFTDTPAFAHRLHFFGTQLDEERLHDVDPETADYLGYIVCRPVPYAPVGRTVLRPPKELADANAVLCLVEDEVSFFGTTLVARGVPFSQQDGQYVRCAHAALWICHYIAYCRGEIGRWTTADLIGLSPSALSFQRAIPSEGLNTPQMQTVLTGIGLPPLMYQLGELPTVLGVEEPLAPEDAKEREKAGRWDTRVISIACRYLNSGFPVMVAAGDHEFLLAGYYYEKVDEKYEVRFVVCDDQTGPYDIIDDALTDDAHGGWWRELMLPQPPKVFLTSEMAENFAHETLSQGHSSDVEAPLTAELPALLADDQLRLRTFLLRGRDYKLGLAKQGRYDEVVRELRLAQLSKWVVVVEAHSHVLRKSGKPYVVAEFVYDATSYDLDPRILAFSYPEFTYVSPPDFAEPRYANTGEETSWESQLYDDAPKDLRV